jgi:hypothetical protein
VSNVFIVFRALRDRYFIRKMDFTHISSWLELSMEGYLIAICVYVEGELGTEISAARQPNDVAHTSPLSTMVTSGEGRSFAPFETSSTAI